MERLAVGNMPDADFDLDEDLFAQFDGLDLEDHGGGDWPSSSLSRLAAFRERPESRQDIAILAETVLKRVLSM